MELVVNWRALSFDVPTTASLKSHRLLKGRFRQGFFEGIALRSPEYRLLMDAASGQRSRLRVSVEVVLSPSEREELSWFVQPYSTVLRPSERQSAALWSSIEAARRINTSSGCSIALLDRLAMPNPVPRVQPNDIACFEHVYWGLLAGNAMSRQLAGAGLSGIKFGQVIIGGQSVGDRCALMCPENVLGPLIDDGFAKIESDRISNRWVARLGLWAFEPRVLQQAKDFNVTSECIDELGRPLWVISKTALSAMASDVLSDAAMRRPVLDSSTRIYASYVNMLRGLLEDVASVANDPEIL